MLKRILILSVLLIVAACDQSAPSSKTKAPKSTSNEAKQVITIVTLNSPNTYYVNSDGQYAGLEYDLATLFGQYLSEHSAQGHTQVKFIVADTVEDVIANLINKDADIAAADLTITEARKRFINFSQPYQEVQQQVVYNQDKNADPPKNVKALLNANIVVPTATSFAERLAKLKQTEPGLHWEERKNSLPEDLLDEVANGDIEYTITDNHLLSLMQNFHPELNAAFSLGEAEQIGWGFPKTGNPELLSQANAFFTQIQKDGTLRNLIDRYHGNSKRLKPVDVKGYLTKIRTVLPKYKRLFQQAQEITGLDWRLIAAISYQESHWDTFNTSPTNVRGLMMLTEETADLMGVTDRLDPKQSIPAGAKYISTMIETVPDRVPEPDRIYMALAAYNIGYAHVEDARVLAQRMGLSPDSWADVKKALVLLNKPEYYRNAKFGYCSGGAPVIFVESIRSYHTILARLEPNYEPKDEDRFKVADSKFYVAEN